MNTMSPIVVPERAEIIMRRLVKAAELGAPCPGNGDLATAIGTKSTGTPSAVVALLESMGLITVERSASFRIVTITATGKRTAGTIAEGRALKQRRADTRRSHVRTGEPVWSGADDALLMELASQELDFEQIGIRVGRAGDKCAARFDEINHVGGYQFA